MSWFCGEGHSCVCMNAPVRGESPGDSSADAPQGGSPSSSVQTPDGHCHPDPVPFPLQGNSHKPPGTDLRACDKKNTSKCSLG